MKENALFRGGCKMPCFIKFGIIRNKSFGDQTYYFSMEYDSGYVI